MILCAVTVIIVILVIVIVVIILIIPFLPICALPTEHLHGYQEMEGR